MCDVCKGNQAVTKVRPWGNPNYSLLDICQECLDNNVLYREY